MINANFADEIGELNIMDDLCHNAIFIDEILMLRAIVSR